MQLAIVPWVWHSETTEGTPAEWWEPPAGSIGAVDLRTQPDRIVRGQYLDHPYSAFLFPDGFRLPSEYERIRANQLGRDTWQALLGHSPEGDTPERMLWNHLLAGDPADLDRCKPKMPLRNRLEQSIGPIALAEPFRYGHHPHTPVVREMVRHMLSIAMEDEAKQRGEITRSRRELDWWCEKLRLRTDSNEWQELVHPRHRSELRPLPHATTWQESWPAAESIGTDSSSTSQNNTWTAVGNPIEVLSTNLVQNLTGTANRTFRCEVELSGADQYVESIMDSSSIAGTQRTSGPAVRMPASARTCYFASQAGGNSDQGTFRPAKLETGTLTLLGTGSTQGYNVVAKRIEAEGDNIRVYSGGTLRESITDTSITSGSRSGFVWETPTALQKHRYRAAEGGDLAAGGDTVSPDNSHHGHTSTEVTILTLEAVQPDDSWHDQHADEATVTQEYIVAPDDSWHAQWSDEATLLQAGSVAPDDSWHAHHSTQAGLVAGAVVSPDDSWHVQTSTEATIAQAGTVSPDDSWHAHTSTEAGVTTVHIVAPDDSWHQQWADEVTVSQDVPGPIVVPNVAWQHWGPMLLMMDDGAGAPIAVGLSIRFHGAVVLQKVNANAVVLQTTQARSLVL